MISDSIPYAGEDFPWYGDVLVVAESVTGALRDATPSDFSTFRNVASL